MSEGLRVELTALESAATFQDGQRDRLGSVAQTVRAATANGNTFGLIGELTGLADSYRTWQESEVTQLGKAGAATSDLAAGLRQTADTYRQADQDSDTHIRELDTQVETAQSSGPGGSPR